MEASASQVVVMRMGKVVQHSSKGEHSLFSQSVTLLNLSRNVINAKVQ